MDVANANDYMEYLQSLSTKDFKQYISKWNEIYNGSDSFGKAFFKDDIDNLGKEYKAG